MKKIINVSLLLVGVCVYATFCVLIQEVNLESVKNAGLLLLLLAVVGWALSFLKKHSGGGKPKH